MEQRQNIFSLNEVNPVVRLLIISDFFLMGGFGLVTPIFALFITDFIQGATLESVGIATTIYLVTRSVAQMPFGIMIDKIRGQRDDALLLVIGSFGFIGVSLSYLVIDTVFQLYLVQFIFGIISAASFPTWYAIFTRAVDKGKEGLEWSAYQTIVDISGAMTAAIGSFVAAQYGFNTVFILMAILNAIGAVTLLWMMQILWSK